MVGARLSAPRRLDSACVLELSGTIGALLLPSHTRRATPACTKEKRENGTESPARGNGVYMPGALKRRPLHPHQLPQRALIGWSEEATSRRLVHEDGQLYNHRTPTRPLNIGTRLPSRALVSPQKPTGGRQADFVLPQTRGVGAVNRNRPKNPSLLLRNQPYVNGRVLGREAELPYRTIDCAHHS
ncbi:hypothetical protein SRHO_G00210370 [Serrasalmus rhombeus]